MSEGKDQMNQDDGLVETDNDNYNDNDGDNDNDNNNDNDNDDDNGNDNVADQFKNTYSTKILSRKIPPLL